MWKAIIERVLTRLITWGELTVTYPDGSQSRYGPGGGIASALKITSDRAVRELCYSPPLALGEGYMRGDIQIPDDELDQLFRLLLRNQHLAAMPAWHRASRALQTRFAMFMQRNTTLTARKNVAHHYDISDDLYRLFLDADMQYSCAYFSRADMTLEEAQEAKKAHIAKKLLIEPDMRVLDIGCGWGGMAITLALDWGARVVGVTLSENQLATAQARAEAAGVADRVEFRLQDYRTITDSFDRIVSVGMLEHVGVPHYRAYFEKVDELLGADGVALIHSIFKSGPPRPNNAWIDKYIFPGSYAPSASEIYAALEHAWLIPQDDECLRLHYAYTLREWHRRFEANKDKIDAMFDAAFVRMFRFYLAAMAASFADGQMHVQQLQLAKHMRATPITRDYLHQTASAPSERLAAE
ncbi:MAG: cyclopropane-fatty-acyl-phospholipid synthase family protein [Pseudomonadota bacterium]